ncbi:hypothetical protein AAC387_Pa01g2610 [Persea americana]
MALLLLEREGRREKGKENINTYIEINQTNDNARDQSRSLKLALFGWTDTDLQGTACGAHSDAGVNFDVDNRSDAPNTELGKGRV